MVSFQITCVRIRTTIYSRAVPFIYVVSWPWDVLIPICIDIPIPNENNECSRHLRPRKVGGCRDLHTQDPHVRAFTSRLSVNIPAFAQDASLQAACPEVQEDDLSLFIRDAFWRQRISFQEGSGSRASIPVACVTTYWMGICRADSVSHDLTEESYIISVINPNSSKRSRLH